MAKRRFRLRNLLPLFLVLPLTGAAFAKVEKYAEKDFNEALNQGKTVIVGVHASWCPTCKKQEPIIERLSSHKEFQKAIFFRVDLDHDREFLKRFNVSTQSTLIVFKGTKEIARSTGETSTEKIKELFLRGM